MFEKSLELNKKDKFWGNYSVRVGRIRKTPVAKEIRLKF
jgi:hypothetical protein